MNMKKSYLTALIAALVFYILWLTYHLSATEVRLGKIEHFLAHQGFFEPGCHNSHRSHR
jgi:hypothetical protein